MTNQSKHKDVIARMARNIEVTGIDGNMWTFDTRIIDGDFISIAVEDVYANEDHQEIIARGELYKFICDIMGIEYKVGA